MVRIELFIPLFTNDDVFEMTCFFCLRIRGRGRETICCQTQTTNWIHTKVIWCRVFECQIGRLAMPTNFVYIYMFIFSRVRLAHTHSHTDDYAIQVIHNQFADQNRNNLKSIVRFNDYGCLITESSRCIYSIQLHTIYVNLKRITLWTIEQPQQLFEPLNFECLIVSVLCNRTLANDTTYICILWTYLSIIKIEYNMYMISQY